MIEPVRNRRVSWELSERDVEAAIKRIAAGDEEAARGAEDVYGSLTWGEGPDQIRLAGVRDWL